MSDLEISLQKRSSSNRSPFKLGMRIAALILVLLGTAVRSEGAGRKSDRERENLKGPVKTVLVEIAKLTTRAGALEEKSRIPWLATTYDRSGNRIQEDQLYTDISLNFKALFTYDSQGNPVEGAEYDYKGGLDYKWVYAHDPKANRVEETRYEVKTNALFSKSGYVYDDRGNLIEETRFHAPSRNHFKWVNTYDLQGNKIEEAFYVSKGEVFLDGKKSKIDYRTVYRYDDSGTLVEETRTEGSGAMRYQKRYTYEFDAAGNWIKQFAQEGDSSGPTEVTYRTITYY